MFLGGTGKEDGGGLEHWERSRGGGHQQWSREGRAKRSRGTGGDERKMTQERGKKVCQEDDFDGTTTWERRGEDGGGHPVAA